MEKIGLVDKVFLAIIKIYDGRNGLDSDGSEHEGRIFYETGLADAMSAFQEAQTDGDLKTLILAELTFIQQEFQFCNKDDVYTKSSLTQAIQSFEDALLSLEAVEELGYRTANKTYPQNPKYRVNNFPKDAFHLACIAH